MKIGILALQGAFAEHAKVLDQLGVEAAAVIRRVRALIGITGRKGHAGGDLSEV